MSNFYREIINSELPEGSIWKPKEDDDLDLYLNGKADNFQAIKDFLSTLSLLRSPTKTLWLDDLEREYGIPKNPVLPEENRRTRLNAIQTDKNNDGTDAFLQRQLQASGFDIFVYRNSPTVDPALILQGNVSVCGNANSICGNTSVVCARTAGDIVVNGDLFKQGEAFEIISGGLNSICGNSGAICGTFTSSIQIPIEYTLPTNSGYWPLIFFVGGNATFNLDGSIQNIESAKIPITRRAELKRLIVKYKPIFAWCVLIVSYTGE